MTSYAAKGLPRLWAKLQEKLEKHKELEISPEVRQKLLKVSASTIGRLLKPLKDRYRLGKGKERY